MGLFGRTPSYQVLKERRELLGEACELEESGAHLSIIPDHAVVPKLLQKLNVLLLVLHVNWEHRHRPTLELQKTDIRCRTRMYAVELRHEL